jgi:hypothetical protein
MDNVIKRIMDLKTKSIDKSNRHYMWQSVNGTTRIDITSEKVDKNNSAKNSSNASIEEDIERFLFNRYNR